MATASQGKWIMWEERKFAKYSVSVRGEQGINALRKALEIQRRSWDGTFSMDGSIEVKGELKETDKDFILTFYRRKVANPVGLKELLNAVLSKR